MSETVRPVDIAKAGCQRNRVHVSSFQSYISIIVPLTLTCHEKSTTRSFEDENQG